MNYLRSCGPFMGPLSTIRDPWNESLANEWDISMISSIGSNKDWSYPKRDGLVQIPHTLRTKTMLLWLVDHVWTPKTLHILPYKRNISPMRGICTRFHPLKDMGAILNYIGDNKDGYHGLRFGLRPKHNNSTLI